MLRVNAKYNFKNFHSFVFMGREGSGFITRVPQTFNNRNILIRSLREAAKKDPNHDTDIYTLFGLASRGITIFFFFFLIME